MRKNASLTGTNGGRISTGQRIPATRISRAWRPLARGGVAVEEGQLGPGRTGCGGSAGGAGVRRSPPRPSHSRGGPCSPARTSASPSSGPAPGGPGDATASLRRDGSVTLKFTGTASTYPFPFSLARSAQLRAAAVDFVAGQESERHAAADRGGDHLSALLGLGGELHVIGHPGAPAPRRARAPRLGQVEAEVEGSMTAAGHIRGEDHGLAVLHLAGDPGVLVGRHRRSSAPA